jgi:hypothetical protein
MSLLLQRRSFADEEPYTMITAETHAALKDWNALHTVNGTWFTVTYAVDTTDAIDQVELT